MAVSVLRRGLAAIRRYTGAGMAWVRAVAYHEIDLPQVNLAPYLGIAVALFAIVSISVAGFTAWQVFQKLPKMEKTAIVAVRDHHPPAVNQPAARQPAAPAIDFEADAVALASGPEDDMTGFEAPVIAGLDDIDAQNWYGGDSFAESEEVLIATLPPPSGIPMRPETPDAAVAAQPLWLANAVDPPPHGDGPMIAIVIDDAGVAQKRTRHASELPGPLTMAFIPYSDNLEQQVRYARSRGHELLLHIPMEPGSPDIDPGHNALLTSLNGDEIMRRFRWALDKFDGYVGVNNHMGSKFMARGDLVGPVLREIDARGLLFLDSRTDHNTAGTRLAGDMGMPHATRNVFLDNDLDAAEIKVQLAELERVARRRGHAIAIGHPHDVTTDVLAEWIPEARARGFQMVPVSTIVKMEYGPRLAAVSAGGEPEGLLGGAQ